MEKAKEVKTKDKKSFCLRGIVKFFKILILTNNLIIYFINKLIYVDCF